MRDLAARARVGLLVARSTTEADGIRDYTQLLSRALRDTSLDTELFEWDGVSRGLTDDAARTEVAAELATVDALVLQYNPFSFGRWGFAPALPLFLARLRRRPRRPLIAVMFHETYVDMRSPSWALMGSWQRAQLLAVQAAADVQLCSIQRWTERLRRTARGRPVHHLPVASNLPDARRERDRTRDRLSAGPDTLILTCLGLRHAGRLEQYVLSAARVAGAAGQSVLVLNLGPGRREVERLGGNVLLYSTGFLAADQVACHVAASDVFLAPYMDGVSTRRGTVMAALQHAVPIVGTAGHLTDDVLREASGFVLTGLRSAAAFADAVAQLARDSHRRTRLGAAGRELYEHEFDWPVLARRLRTALDV